MDLTNVLRGYFSKVVDGVSGMKVLVLEKETVRIIGTVLRCPSRDASLLAQPPQFTVYRSTVCGCNGAALAWRPGPCDLRGPFGVFRLLPRLQPVGDPGAGNVPHRDFGKRAQVCDVAAGRKKASAGCSA